MKIGYDVWVVIIFLTGHVIIPIIISCETEMNYNTYITHPNSVSQFLKLYKTSAFKEYQQ